MTGLLTGKRIAVLGSSTGLGRSVVTALARAGASVTGIDATPVHDGLDSFLHADPADGGLMVDVAAALPDGLDGLALFPHIAGDPARVLTQGVTAPLTLARALTPRMGQGASIVTRAFGAHADKARHLGAVRGALALRVGDEAAFAKRWGLLGEPVWAERIAGWANLAFAQDIGQGPRRNTVSVGRMDGHFDSVPPMGMGRDMMVAGHDTGGDATGCGPDVVAQAVVFLLSDLARGLTGVNLAADGGRSARIEAVLGGY